ncbi:DUF1738 domain-containing protein [bacterium]|nr:DUF1738 domain-containing protein [bacterium]
MSKKVYEVITDRILKLLSQGTVPWRKPWSSISGLPKNLISEKTYRGVNLFMLAFSGYASPFWVTFRQCKERGGHVRKGEQGWPIIFWKDLRPMESEGKGTDEDEDHPQFVVRYYTVFNATQCEDLDYPQPEIRNADFDPLIQCEQIVAQMPYPPAITHDKAQAFYAPKPDLVNVPPGEFFQTEGEYYSALFHELAHSTGHESRLNRTTLCESKGFGSDPYCREELVAEMTAAMLCGLVGIDGAVIENSAAYIAHWIEKLKEDPKLVVFAASQAQKAADFIVGKSVLSEAN